MIGERKKIEKVYAASGAALAAGDLTELSSYYTDDAVQFPPDSAPRVGWARIRASLEKELGGITFDSKVKFREIAVFGELAYVWGSYQGTSFPTAGGGLESTSGSFLDVLTRQPDGSWKIARSAWSNHKVDGAQG